MIAKDTNRMEKKMLFFAMFLLSLSLISSFSISGGESYSFSSAEFDYWEVIGNSSNMDGMEIIWENGNTTISFQKDFATDDFTLVFFNPGSEIVKVPYSVGGGGGSSKTITEYVDRNVTKYVDRNITTIVEKEVPGESVKPYRIWQKLQLMVEKVLPLMI